MNVSSMRRVDRWIGLPTCVVLTLLRRLDDLVLRRRSDGPPRKIAVLKLAEQGATVLAYPALRQAREVVGEENLYFVVFEQNRFILDVLDVVRPENIISIRTRGVAQAAIETLRAVWRMRREGIDAVLDFEFFARSTAILTYLSGARMRVGYHAYAGEASYRGDLMTHRLSFNPFLHASEIFQVLVQALGMPADRLPALNLSPPKEGELPEYRPDPKQTATVEGILRESLGVDTLPPLILFNANCSDLLPLRRWATDRYRELSQRLLERYPEIGIVFTGPPDEVAPTQVLADSVGSKRCVSLAGKTTLEQLMVLYTLSDLLVTNDSGPAHFSTVTGIDVITLFGPETPAAFGSRSPRSHILWSGIVCSPCVNAFNDRQTSCHDNVCMQNITVDQVFELACEVYEKRRGQPASGPFRASSSSS